MVNIIHQKSENTSNVNCRIYNKGDIVLTLVDGHPALMSCALSEGDTLELTGAKNMKVKRSDIPLKGIVIGVQRSL